MRGARPPSMSPRLPLGVAGLPHAAVQVHMRLWGVGQKEVLAQEGRRAHAGTLPGD